MSFVHLHVHSEYSLLDGFSNIKKLVKRAKEMAMPAIALTDHGTMFGTIEFYKAAKDAGVKPIIGLEAYLAPRTMKDKDSKLDKQAYHLLLLAENETGYKNLLQIASTAQLEGFYYNPRIDHEFLEAHADGLICTSGCLAAEIPRTLMNQGVDQARMKLDWYYEVFGPDRFFIELQQHNIQELETVNKALLELGPRYDAKFIATNDTHYINPEDARLQDILLAIQTGALLTDPNRFRMSDQSYYLRSPEEMSALFREVPSALANTLAIAERCEVDLSMKGYHLPLFPVPEGYDAERYLRELCEEGLRRRYGARANAPEVRKRLEYELGVIHQMGFDTYFLIVWDLCRYAREVGIWYNARGSAAGSMVAYTLDITLVEPLNHGLIFERFLNPGRVSMPDIDLDFQDDLRPKVMEYCAGKYGDDKVAQIITFGTLGARAAIRDVGRVMDIPIPEVDRVAKLIPNIPGKPTTIAEALDQSPEFKQIYEETEYLHSLIDTARQMEGAVRNAGTHAAGVIITDKPIIEYVPLHRPTSGSEDSPIKSVSQFEMSIVEGQGLLKVDFLGLTSLTVMQRACDMIEARHGVKLTLENIPTDDPESYQFMGQGHTAGIFQLEGTGMTRYLLQMQPRNLDNIIAMVALYRPGPLEFIPTYIRRMHGEEPTSYRHPALEPIFKDTYGIPIYQEQIMFAAIDLAGYTASEADDLRKAIAKKKADQIAKHRVKFVQGAQEKGIEEAVASGIFEDWENFARYGFNKCLPGSVEVIDAATGRLVRIENLYRQTARLNTTVTLDTTALKLQTGRVAKVMENGVKPVYKLTTASGRAIEATANHPFYTMGGWCLLEDLKTGQHIAAPRTIPVEGNQEWPDHEVIALGHLLAEGNLCHPHSVYFYNQDPTEVEDFISAAEQFENVRCASKLHKGTFSVYAGRVDRKTPPGLFTWAGKLGLLGKTAAHKEIPVEAFELTNRQLGLLISRLWLGDGHIDTTSRCLFYATASERLARQIQHLLLRLGILSSLRTVRFPYKEGRTGYQLFITGNGNIARFLQWVGRHFIPGAKMAALEALVLGEVPAAAGTRDIIPTSVKELVRGAKDRSGLTWTELNVRTGVAQREFYPTPSAGKVGFKRETINRLAVFFHDPALKRLAESDVYWDRIESIEYVGEKQTYDLEVPETHNFVANDLIVHNSHAADYGVIAVQTAYLKAHYTVEYMTALLSASKNDTAKVALYVADCRAMGIDVLPPSINESVWDFSIEDRPEQKPAIRFGLGAIKNVGQGPVDILLAARKDGPIGDLNNFCRRVDLRTVGKRALESLVRVGALDVHGPRKSLLAALDQILSVSTSHFRAAQSGQMSFFGTIAGVEEDIILPPTTSLDRREQLEWERELMGLYVTDHPLSPYLHALKGKITHYSGQLSEAASKEKVAVAGIITRFRQHQTKNGDAMGFVTLEDVQGNVECVLFPRTWKEFNKLVEMDAVLLAEGKVDAAQGDPKVLVDRLRKISLDDLPETAPESGRASVYSMPRSLAPVKKISEPFSTPPASNFSPPMPPDAWDDSVPPPPEPDDWNLMEGPGGEDWSGPMQFAGEPARAAPRLAAAPVIEPDAPLESEPPEQASEPGLMAAIEPDTPETGPAPTAAQTFTVPEKSAAFVPLSYIVPPSGPAQVEEAGERGPHMITVVLRASGDKPRDARRLRHVHGMLKSCPGKDRFALLVFEGGHSYLLEFPNDTTGISPGLLQKLAGLVGEENVRVETIKLQ